MDYNSLDSIMRKAGIADDPAFKDLNVTIAPLPDEYNSGNILGLYYPDRMPATIKGQKTIIAARTAIIPPEAEPDTAFHELGHAFNDYYRRDISECPANNYMAKCMKKLAPAMRGPAAYSPIGSYTQIVNVGAPAIVNPGDTVTVSVTVKNLYYLPMTIEVVGTYDTNRFINWLPLTLDSGQQGTVTGQFIMPANSTIIDIMVYYYGSDGYEYQDSEQLVTVNSQGSYQVPSDYALKIYTLYPDAAFYTGDAQSCSFTFTAPLTIIPGVEWLVQNMLGAYVNACLTNGVTPLELKIYTRPAVLGSTDYLVQLVGYPTVAPRRNPAALAVIAWAAIIGGIALAIGIVIIFAIKAVTEYRYGPPTTSTTTTQPQTQNVKPSQSFTVTSGTATITNGATPSQVVNSKSGQTTTIPPGGVAILGPNDTFVAGEGGASAYIPAQTTTLTGPSNPQGTDTAGDIAKYVAIGAIAIVGSIALIAAFQAFGRREVYPTAARI